MPIIISTEPSLISSIVFNASFLLTRNIITSDITGGLSAMLVDSPDLEI